MIKQELYICEHCRTQYKEKRACADCEKSHIQPIRIDDCKFVSIKNDKSGYPISVTIMMENGLTREYRRK